MDLIKERHSFTSPSPLPSPQTPIGLRALHNLNPFRNLIIDDPHFVTNHSEKIKIPANIILLSLELHCNF